MLEESMIKVLSLCQCTVDGVVHCSYHFTGLSLLRPMYYEFPESPEAYTAPLISRSVAMHVFP